MMPKIIDDITAKQQTCYFISPHYDDMVFSAAALALELKKTNRIVVINIFTKASNSHTLSAKAYLKQCGYTDAEKLYQDRDKEDKLALKALADEVIDLGFPEALWRTKSSKRLGTLAKIVPELNSVYPTYRFNIIKGKIAQADGQFITDITSKLSELIPDPEANVFCPMGIGNHIDHIITHTVCEKLFVKPIYWADYPYSLAEVEPALPSKEMFIYQDNLEQKVKLIEKYKTQYKAIFGTGELQLDPEHFYINLL